MGENGARASLVQGHGELQALNVTRRFMTDRVCRVAERVEQATPWTGAGEVEVGCSIPLASTFLTRNITLN